MTKTTYDYSKGVEIEVPNRVQPSSRREQRFPAGFDSEIRSDAPYEVLPAETSSSDRTDSSLAEIARTHPWLFHKGPEESLKPQTLRVNHINP